MKRIAVLLASLFIVSQASASEEYLYIMSAHAKLMAQPTFSAEAVENVSKGEKLVSLSKKNNRWFKVRYKGTTGWISRLAVSPHPPSKRARRLVLDSDELGNNARRRASSVSTTAAVRGLKGDRRNRLGGFESATDYDALARVENSDISEMDLLAFMSARPQH